MDTKIIASTLNNTLDPNPAIRVPAETQLGQLEKTPGYHASLLELITVNDIPIQLRQAAILRLKNIVKHYWTIREGEAACISPADRKCIKDNILEAIIFQQAPLIRVQLLEICFWVVRGDFPEQWPQLLPAIMQNFQSNDELRIYGALSVLLKIYKKYPYKQESERGALVEQTFPTLQGLFQAIINNNTRNSFEMQRILVKIFSLATQLSIPAYIKTEAIAKAWYGMLLQILNTPLPKDQYPADMETLKEVPLWAAKKWVCRIFNRTFSRFGRDVYVQDETKPFAKMFYEELAPVILEAFFKVLQARAAGEPITDWVLQLTYNFIDNAVTHAALYKLMKPHIHFILLENVFPTLCITPADMELWRDNPQEFVRKSLDIMEEFHDPRVAATNLLVDLVKVRTRASLDMVLSAVMQILNAYQQKQGDMKTAIHKDAALRMIGSLRKLLLGNEKYKQAIEDLIVTHVFPEFQSTFGFLRARAAWTVGQFSKLEYANKDNYGLAVRMTCNCLTDGELPVKLEAAMAISRLVQNDEVPEYIKPQVPLLLEQFFRIIDEVGNEEVVSTLATLIGQIGEDIAPYAVEITNRLSKMFLGLCNADVEDDESAMTAVQCLRAINTILYSLEGLPDTYARLEECCAGVIDITLTEERGIDFIDDILEMMTCFLYYGKGVSQFMWSLVPRIVQAFHQWAVDYMSNILPPLDCIISKGVDVLCSSQDPNFLQLILSMPKVLLEDPEDSKEPDAKWACKLLESIISHCKGKIDNIIPDILKLVTMKLFVAKDVQLKLLLLDVIGQCAFYNPMLFVATVKLGGPEFEQKLFNEWLSHLEKMKKVRKHQKIAVLGLSSLLHIPITELPNLMRQSYGEIMNQLLLVLTRLKDLGAEEEESEEESDYEQEEVLDLEDDQDAQYAIQDMASFTQAVLAEAEFGEMYDDCDAENYTSPIDDVEEFLFYAQSLEGFAARETAFYQNFVANPQVKGQVDAVIAEAHIRKAKKEQEAQEEAKKS